MPRYGFGGSPTKGPRIQQPAPNVPDADAYLKPTDRWPSWSELDDETKGQLIASAAIKLRAAYACLTDIPNEYIYLQAAYMTTTEYAAAYGGLSSLSASMTGVSVGFAATRVANRRDGLDPDVLGFLGDPDIVCPQGAAGKGRVKVGWGL